MNSETPPNDRIPTKGVRKRGIIIFALFALVTVIVLMHWLFAQPFGGELSVVVQGLRTNELGRLATVLVVTNKSSTPISISAMFQTNGPSGWWPSIPFPANLGVFPGGVVEPRSTRNVDLPAFEFQCPWRAVIVYELPARKTLFGKLQSVVYRLIKGKTPDERYIWSAEVNPFRNNSPASTR